MQRIEAGKLRGRRLMRIPDNVPGLRPTSARVRGAILARLQHEVPEASVLDLFAGSGALSIEALSRGAARATLLDRDRRVVKFLRDQLAALGLREVASVEQVDALAYVARPASARHDLVFIDPPFATPEVFDPLMQHLVAGWLSEDAVVVCERERIRGKTPEIAWPPGLVVESSKIYGQAQVDFARFCGPSPAQGNESRP